MMSVEKRARRVELHALEDAAEQPENVEVTGRVVAEVVGGVEVGGSAVGEAKGPGLIGAKIGSGNRSGGAAAILMPRSTNRMRRSPSFSPVVHDPPRRRRAEVVPERRRDQAEQQDERPQTERKRARRTGGRLVDVLGVWRGTRDRFDGDVGKPGFARIQAAVASEAERQSQAVLPFVSVFTHSSTGCQSFSDPLMSWEFWNPSMRER